MTSSTGSAETSLTGSALTSLTGKQGLTDEFYVMKSDLKPDDHFLLKPETFVRILLQRKQVSNRFKSRLGNLSFEGEGGIEPLWQGILKG